MVHMLSRGPHTAIVTPRVRRQGDLGTEWTPGDPVTVTRLSIQPVAAEEAPEGVSASGTYRVFAAGTTWPGSALSRITIPSGPLAGEYEQHGPPQVWATGSRLDHTVVLITTRAVEAT